ncbi:phosphoribosyltransferase family protein [Glaciibacter psychrotolerans]|uniref:Putative phosphoribosyltransferase n=1 Tax=Glaciibacter psychrotolerans TaxID=670054 RepID=A0A7Z0ED26_9MICO|nr:putative phosphoribosyltransferase [Leifsonia psychrotolerans]
MIFVDRTDAGRRLAEHLLTLHLDDPIVFALPRGGVPIGVEVARALGAPLDVLIVRKIGAPGYPEVALAAVADPTETGADALTVINDDVYQATGRDSAGLDQARAEQLREIDRRRARYRGSRAPLDVRGRCALVVDDGVATGATARAALSTLRAQGAASTVLAVPVGPADTLAEMGQAADVVVFLHAPRAFWAIGAFYGDFHQLSDDETVAALSEIWG